MSDSFLLPSAKQIIKYSDGEFFDENIPSFYRFHTGRTFIWIELSRGMYNICVRGYYYTEWIPSKKILSSYKRFFESISGYFSLVRRLLNDLYK